VKKTFVVRGSLLPAASEGSDREACFRPVRPGQLARSREASAIAWSELRRAVGAGRRSSLKTGLQQRLKLFSAGAGRVTNLPMTERAGRKSGAATALIRDSAHAPRIERHDGRTRREAASLINRIDK
jgi:hypothetical protein